MNWPSNDTLIAAWRRLTDDPTTGGELAALALPPLVRALTGWRPGVHPDDVETAATDAVLALLKHPSRYEPTQSPLLAFLTFVARRRLMNRYAADRRHRDGKIPWDDVEFSLADGNEDEDNDAPSFDHPDLQPVIAALSEVDRRVLDLMRDGERGTPAFAALLGIADRPADEQEREVKRAKDRIKARLKRAAGGTDG